MKKLFCLLISVFMLFSIVPSWGAKAADDIIFLGTNDRLWELSLQVMPINIGGKTYVPYTVFKDGLNTKAVHNQANKTLVLYEWSDMVVFDLAQGYSYDKGMNHYSAKAVEKSGIIYVPAEFVCKMLKYDYYYNSNIPLLRMKTAEGLASNQRFVQAASPMLEGIRNSYIKSLPSITPTPPTPTQPSGKTKVAYLTFDDGPNTAALQILDVLDSYKVKGVFFVLGVNIYKNDSIMRRIYADGHAIGLHSYTHIQNLFYSTPEGMLKELSDCNTALYKTIKKRTHLMRTPYGSKPYLTAELRDALAENGYRFWDWNVDSRDSVSGATASSILSAVKSQTASKTSAIILMHCKSTTAKALPNIIKYLIQSGFTIKTFDETDTPVNFYHDVR